MVKVLSILGLQTIFLLFNSNILRFFLYIFQLIIYFPTLKKFYFLQRWYTFLIITFSYLIGIYSVLLGLFQGKIYFLSDLYDPTLFFGDSFYLSQKILNLFFNVLMLFSIILFRNKYRDNKSYYVLKDKLKVQISTFYRFIEKFSDIFLINTLLINTLVISIFVFIGPTIIQKEYPHQGYYQILKFYYALPLIILPAALHFIALKKESFKLFISTSIGFFISISSFIIYFGSRGFVFSLISFYCLTLLIDICKKGWKYLLSIYGLIKGSCFILFSYMGFLLLIYFPMIRGLLYVSNLSNNIFSFWNLLFNLPFYKNETTFNYFTQGYININLFNYDTHLSFNEAFYQLLVVIDMLRRGYSNGFKTFINLPLQSLPSIFDGILYQRPISDSQVLSELELDGVRSGGGFLIHANLFWNNEWIGLILGILLISIFVFWIDNSIINCKIPHLIIYFISLPIYLVQFFYGVQGLFRILELVLISNIVFRLFSSRNRI